MKEALPNIDFADASLKYFKLNDENDLFIYFESWDHKKIELIFSKIIKLKYQIGDFISNVYELRECDCENHIINNNLNYGNTSYKVFFILDIYDFSVFEIIAEKATGLIID